MGKEIEKKFVVEEQPFQCKEEFGKTIHQTYVATGEEEIRVRKIISHLGENYTMTIKKGTGMTREEIEFPILKETYNQLLDNSDKKALIKTRYKVTIGENQFDFDVYKNAHIPNLKTLEVEFISEETAHAFVKPDWFGEEVTEDITYKNQSLWEKIQ